VIDTGLFHGMIVTTLQAFLELQPLTIGTGLGYGNGGVEHTTAPIPSQRMRYERGRSTTLAALIEDIVTDAAAAASLSACESLASVEARAASENE
jgi:hypothetical protein